jgi:hypothetical protein
LNPYAYVGGGVMRRVDPLGLDPYDDGVPGGGTGGGQISDDQFIGSSDGTRLIGPLADDEDWQMGARRSVFTAINDDATAATIGPFPAELALDLDPDSPLNPWGKYGTTPTSYHPYQPSLNDRIGYMCQGMCPTHPWSESRRHGLLIAGAPSPAGGVGAIVESTGAAAAPEAAILGRPFRVANPVHLPNPAAAENMASMNVCQSTDCSEIAGRLLDSAGTGRIIRVEPGVPGTLRTLENGAIEGDMFYHEAYTDGAYVFDPRMSGSAIPKGDWFKVTRGLNPGVRIR